MLRSWAVDDTRRVLGMPTADDDKYSRGVVGLRTGSRQFPGAAVLGVAGAWRTGVGMVRYVGPARATRLVLARRPETVTVSGRVQAWVIGSGTSSNDRADAETQALRAILRGAEPVVVDAGALDLATSATAPTVITPHAGEHARLRATLGLDSARARSGPSAAETAATLGAVVLLKGSTTVVASPDGWQCAIEAPTSWLATAGTGDVLAGILGAVTASAVAREASVSLAECAATAAWLHGQAARAASDAVSGGPITALDVAERVPAVVGRVLTLGQQRGAGTLTES